MNGIQRAFKKAVLGLAIPFFVVRGKIRGALGRDRRRNWKIGFLSIEFFDKGAGGFGGYGKTAKNITDHFNSNGNTVSVEMILTRSNAASGFKRLHDTAVLVAPDPERLGLWDTLKYAGMLHRRNFDLLLTMDYYPAYRHSLAFLAKTPVVVWIHDPRPLEKMEKITTVSLEVQASGEADAAGYKKHALYKEESIKKILSFSRLCGRKVLFATAAQFLIPLAKKTYGLSDIQPVVLPTAIPLPSLENAEISSKPSFCFLARLDPIKRPWIYFELARRFPDFEFYVAGITNFPKLMDPIIKKYVDLPNLKFLGLVTGEKKDKLLRKVWGLINTSVHEGLPVSFLEALSYGKPIISCVNPEQLPEQFGVYTGEVLGNGFDGRVVEVFAQAIERLLADEKERQKKGRLGRKLIEERYTLQNFERIIGGISRELVNGR